MREDPSSGEKRTGGKKGLRIFLTILIIFAGIIGMGVVGTLLANYVFVPCLVVGKGNEVEVPDVVGLPLEEALVLLEEQGFEPVGDEKRPDTLYEEGRVVEQNPASGSNVKKGRIIHLTVSSGQESVRVPYLLGLSIEQATAIAERRDFVIESIDTVQSDSIPQGRIVSMKPDPEIRVSPGTPLKLYISAGPTGKTLMTPNLIDLPLAKVRELLEADSLVLGEVRQIEVEGKGGIVVLQSPDAGVPIGPGDTVTVIVGKEP